MVIKNLTDKVQGVEVREFTDEKRRYYIYLNPGSTTDLEGIYLTHPEELVGIIEMEGYKPEVSQPKVEIKEEPQPEVEEPIGDGEEENIVVNTDEFICEVCGAEFGSARGLASHMSRVHSNQQ